MFRSGNQGAHNSADLSATTAVSSDANQFSKLLVTRRSWLANTVWAKFPRPRPGLRKSRTVDELESPVAWVGDLVDSGIPLREHEAALMGPEAQTRGEDDIRNQAALKEFLKVHGFRWYQLVFFLFSAVTYVSDVGSDAYLVYSYHRQGDYYWSGLTLALLIIPAIVMTAFSLAWYVLDRKVQVDPPRTCRVWTLRLFFHGLQLAPLVRLADAIYYGLASRQAGLSLAMAVQYTQLMLYEDADSAMLRMIECFMEAAPQLLLQLYIILTQETPEHKFQFFAQVVSCFTSWLSLAWSLTHYQTALRRSRVEKANLNWLGSILFYLWKALMLSSRILSLALFAAVARGLWFGLAFGFHWLLCILWLVTRGTTFCSPNPCTFTEILFDVVLGAVYCFDVVNVREGHSRLWYLTCYVVLGVENLLMTALWIIFSPPSTVPQMWMLRTPSLSSWIREVPSWVMPVGVVGCFLLGLVMMVTYYLTAHPSGNIKVCLPCKVLLDWKGTQSNGHAVSAPQPVDTKCSGATETPDSV